MVDLAQAGEVLLSDVMLTRVGDLVEVASPRRARVKGVSVPLTVYALEGLRAPGERGTDPLPAVGRPVLSA